MGGWWLMREKRVRMSAWDLKLGKPAGSLSLDSLSIYGGFALGSPFFPFDSRVTSEGKPTERVWRKTGHTQRTQRREAHHCFYSFSFSFSNFVWMLPCCEINLGCSERSCPFYNVHFVERQGIATSQAQSFLFLLIRWFPPRTLLFRFWSIPIPKYKALDFHFFTSSFIPSKLFFLRIFDFWEFKLGFPFLVLDVCVPWFF